MRPPRLSRRCLLAAGAAGLVAGSAAPAAARDRAGTLAIGGRKLPVRYRNRAGWGADEALRFKDGVEVWPPEYAPVQALTVHHTHIPDGEGAPDERVRSIYRAQCVGNGWGDIGYHLLIDEYGAVYEGRVSGPDPLPVFGGIAPGGRPTAVVAGHVLDHNVGNVGVALIGSFQSRQPTPAQRRSLVHLLAALAAVTGLDPTGGTTYRNPVNGRRRQVPTIAGHRDWAPTDCPGTAFYPTLDSVRRDVKALLGQRPAG